MIADIRIRSDGNSRSLCQLDLMRFSEEQVRERMRVRGIEDDAFFVCGFVDWQVDTIMSLKEAYALKLCVMELYEGDDYIVRYCLKRRLSVPYIISHYYEFVSKNEVETMQKLLKYVDRTAIIEFFYKTNNWMNFVSQYINQGILLNTPKGFYMAT